MMMPAVVGACSRHYGCTRRADMGVHELPFMGLESQAVSFKILKSGIILNRQKSYVVRKPVVNPVLCELQICKSVCASA